MLYAVFPVIAAALYGLCYVLIERATQQVSLTAYYIVSALFGVFFAFTHGYLRNESFPFSYIRENQGVLILMLLATVCGYSGWFFTTYAMKNISAPYAAFGEISYPLFTLFFAWAIFGGRHVDMTTIVGGILIMIGSFILVYGQLRIGQE